VRSHGVIPLLRQYVKNWGQTFFHCWAATINSLDDLTVGRERCPTRNRTFLPAAGIGKF